MNSQHLSGSKHRKQSELPQIYRITSAPASWTQTSTPAKCPANGVRLTWLGWPREERTAPIAYEWLEADRSGRTISVQIMWSGARLTPRYRLGHGRLLLLTGVEFPVPALITADLHVVVCRVLCPVTCAPCWAALCTGESNPRAARCAPERRPDFPPARAVHASATITCSTRPRITP